ncbi:SUKH-4 family immunity protein [Streptomyces sp. NPDC005281]|uniref:SUKH-4 family immunity protein n=1 Tax=Streptomyces sp. NPDC005281 TaxID=3155712 RepID=UPI0033BB67D2
MITDELRRRLSLPLADLVTTQDRQRVSDIVLKWDLPARDLEAVRQWGLPKLRLFTPTHPVAAEPTLDPNLAGDHERRLVSRGQRLYELGFWGSRRDSCVVGVVPGDGRVLCLLPAPITVEDLPPALRPFHEGLHKPATSFFSSSLAQYLETAWRWHAALAILRSVTEPAINGLQEEFDSHYDLLYGCVDLILDAVRRIDPAVAAQEPHATWVELIRANSL